jgi:RNA polymerase sigma-70 factor (ECF subfamily)
MWLFGAARNVLANHARAPKCRHALREDSHALASQEQGPDGTSPLVVRDATERLPLNLKELVQLVHWEGFSITEAAFITGVPPSTAHTRYAGARQLRRIARSDDPLPVAGGDHAEGRTRNVR